MCPGHWSITFKSDRLRTKKPTKTQYIAYHLVADTRDFVTTTNQTVFAQVQKDDEKELWLYKIERIANHSKDKMTSQKPPRKIIINTDDDWKLE